jgi:hypothetical protein
MCVKVLLPGRPQLRILLVFILTTTVAISAIPLHEYLVANSPDVDVPDPYTDTLLYVSAPLPCVPAPSDLTLLQPLHTPFSNTDSESTLEEPSERLELPPPRRLVKIMDRGWRSDDIKIFDGGGKHTHTHSSKYLQVS